MTTTHAIALLAWPPCPLHLPERVRLGLYAEITDVPRFLSLHVTRLDSPSKLLARLSRQALDEFISLTNLPQT